MNPTLTNPVPTTLNGVNVISNPQSFQVPQIDPNSANNALNSAITGLAPQLSQAQTQQTNAETKTNNSNDTLLNLMTQLGGQTADTVNAENQAGLPQLNNELRDLKTLQSQQLAGYIDQINRNANTNPFGQETSGQSNASAGIQRQRGIDALLTSSLIQAKEGNIASAQATIDRAINAKYDPIKNSINVQNQIIKNNYENLTRADKKLADVKLEKNKLQEKQLDRQIEQDTAIQNMLIDASAFQAPLSVINNAKAIIAKGGTPAQVAQALGQYTGASAKAELLREQIKTEKAQREKIYSDIGKTKAETIAKGVTNVTKQKIDDASNIYNLANELLQPQKGKESAVGVNINPLSLVPGSPRYTYIAKYEQLKNALALPNLDKLKGAMSDKDIVFLKNIGTSLTRNMSEKEFDKELKKVQDKMSTVISENGGTSLDQYLDTTISAIDSSEQALSPESYFNSFK